MNKEFEEDYYEGIQRDKNMSNPWEKVFKYCDVN